MLSYPLDRIQKKRPRKLISSHQNQRARGLSPVLSPEEVKRALTMARSLKARAMSAETNPGFAGPERGHRGFFTSYPRGRTPPFLPPELRLSLSQHLPAVSSPDGEQVTGKGAPETVTWRPSRATSMPFDKAATHIA